MVFETVNRFLGYSFIHHSWSCSPSWADTKTDLAYTCTRPAVQPLSSQIVHPHSFISVWALLIACSLLESFVEPLWVLFLTAQNLQCLCFEFVGSTTLSVFVWLANLQNLRIFHADSILKITWLTRILLSGSLGHLFGRLKLLGAVSPGYLGLLGYCLSRWSLLGAFILGCKAYE